jgi:hypothetical protein
MRTTAEGDVMTMGDRIKPTRGQDTGEITGAPTAGLNDPEEGRGSSAHDRAADRQPQRLIEDAAALTDAPGS